jgi:hypothetical protein
MHTHENSLREATLQVRFKADVAGTTECGRHTDKHLGTFRSSQESYATNISCGSLLPGCDMNNSKVRIDSCDGTGDGSVTRTPQITKITSGGYTHDSQFMDRHKIVCDSIMNVISAVRKGHCWFLDAWLNYIPVDFLVDPGAVVSAISYEYYELLRSNTGCSYAVLH